MNKTIKKVAARKAVPAKPVAAKKPSSVPTKPAKKPAPIQKAMSTTPVSSKPAVKPTVKVKLVRDSFTLPESDHALLKACKKMALTSGRETKKSEVVRAAIRAFSTLSLVQQLAAYAALPQIAVGRPKAKR
jgi:hypothetical protein